MSKLLQLFCACQSKNVEVASLFVVIPRYQIVLTSVIFL